MKTTTYLSEGGKVTKTVAYLPEPTKADLLRTNLTIACTAYDYAIRQRAARNPRVYHNPYALSLYMEAIDRTVSDAQVLSVPNAIRMNFCGHMLTNLLRKVTR
jgi:hypothetical protein